MAGTLNNVENLQKAFGKENTELAVVTHGNGLGLLLNTNGAFKHRIEALARTGGGLLHARTQCAGRM